MNPIQAHRKRVQHFDEPGQAHELTFSCYQRLPLLVEDRWQRLLGQSIDRATQSHGFNLVAFVFMPEHVHLIVLPAAESARVERLLYAIKRPFSFRVKGMLEEARDPTLARLTIRERPGKRSFRFWQEGPGYDRNLCWMDAILSAIDYLHDNPVRRQLCESPSEWKWSSWRHYHGPAEGHYADLPRVHVLAP